MRNLRVCFVGVGSIAKRHIKNLRDIAADKKIRLYIDAVRRADSVSMLSDDICLDKVYFSYDEVAGGYDAIFITNPTEYHVDALLNLKGKTRAYFVEKPLASVNSLVKVKEIQCDNKDIYYVACPLRYTKVIQYLKEYVNSHPIYGVRCMSSSFLPEWRAGIDYRNTYSAHKALGGGVSIDLIHEWDYLKFLFGVPINLIYQKGKKSDLEIDCEDTALYIAEYEDKFIELHLDYFGRVPEREIMLFGREETVVGDLIRSQIRFLKSGKIIEYGQVRDEYQKAELEHFLDILNGTPSDNNIKDACETILMTQGILEKM